MFRNVSLMWWSPGDILVMSGFAVFMFHGCPSDVSDLFIKA